ncbi:MAG: type II 3-dehydroquinate dehydratase [Deltaproteobacteria bacterium]|nr:type II 3-dehydroquinate dehydratase [Deltaproteobacteria bacterium]
MAKILLLNGPNLNLLGEREPDIYGKATLSDIEADVRKVVEQAGHALFSFQSNHEGQLVEWLQQNRDARFALVNAASLTHTSIALRDSLSLTKIPFIEVHLSNVYKREAFRHQSYLADIAVGVVAGLGAAGYSFAARYAVDHLAKD